MLSKPMQFTRAIPRKCRAIRRYVFTLTAAALMTQHAHAGTAPYSPTLSGDDFVRLLHATADNKTQQRDNAYHYLDGVRDVTQGKLWCDVDQLKTPDLAYDLSAEISRLPPAARKGNAALLLLDSLQRKFPCSSAHRRGK